MTANRAVMYLLDFRVCNVGSEQLLDKLKLKLQSPIKIVFSNKFEEIGKINCNCSVYGVQLSKSCSCLIALGAKYFTIINIETRQVQDRFVNGNATHFEIEENYDGTNDAILCQQSGESIQKFNLKEFIKTKGKCEPVWTFLNEEVFTGIKIMDLNGKRVIVIIGNSKIYFLNAKNGDLLNCTLDLGVDSYYCFGVDHFKQNILYTIDNNLFMTFELVNGVWNRSEQKSVFEFADLFSFTDRTSGHLFFGVGEGLIIVSTSGELIAENQISSMGLCIDDRTGYMYATSGCHVVIMK